MHSSIPYSIFHTPYICIDVSIFFAMHTYIEYILLLILYTFMYFWCATHTSTIKYIYSAHIIIIFFRHSFSFYFSAVLCQIWSRFVAHPPQYSIYVIVKLEYVFQKSGTTTVPHIYTHNTSIYA